MNRQLLQEAHDAIEAFTDQQGHMPADTGEFRDLQKVLASLKAALSQPAPQGVAEVMERIPNAARLYYTGSPTRRYCRASTTKGPGEPLVFRDLAEREIRRLVQERDARRAALDPAVAEIVKLKVRIAELEANYHELLYAVAHKRPDETRHQTALRYIMQAEKAHGPHVAGAASSKEPSHG